MTTKIPPMEGQQVQVKLYDGQWQDATYRRGGYIDRYGLPLDPTRIAQWRSTVDAPHAASADTARPARGQPRSRSAHP